VSLLGFFRRDKPKPARRGEAGQGLLVFANTSEVIRAEKTLTDSQVPVRVMGPPPELRHGCDLVIAFPLMAKLRILRLLVEANLVPLEVVPVSGPLLHPVELFQVTEYPGHLMVRAANMKLVVDRQTRRIVNVSGGGCPDVPSLAARLIGQTLGEGPRPRDIGHTLCGYALELAYAEMVRRCSPS
jgi:hypothetical protein